LANDPEFLKPFSVAKAPAALVQPSPASATA
jgi:hypothetical protein